MAEPYLGEIRLMSFAFAPKGWAQCNGQLLPINQYQALFSILGTMYGGDGRVNFALPDLRGRVPMHLGGAMPQGAQGGEEAHTLTRAELAGHTHQARAVAAQATTPDPAGALWAATPAAHYATSVQAVMAPGAVQPVGGSQPHANMPPYLTLSFAIALQGVFPSRS